MKQEVGFAKRLKEAARRVGGQAELARLAGVPKATMASYARGGSEPNVERLVTLAKSAGVSVEWLATGDDEAPSHQEGANVWRAQLGAEPPGGLMLPPEKKDERRFDEKRLDEIERLVEAEQQLPIPTDRVAQKDELSRALTYIRTLVPDQNVRRTDRLRGARLGEDAFGDPEIARLREELDEQKLRKTGHRFRQISTDLADAAKEVGYEPPDLVWEGIKAAMYSHGLTRDGAVTLLQFIQAQFGDRNDTE